MPKLSGNDLELLEKKNFSSREMPNVPRGIKLNQDGVFALHESLKIVVRENQHAVLFFHFGVIFVFFLIVVVIVIITFLSSLLLLLLIIYKKNKNLLQRNKRFFPPPHQNAASLMLRS